METAAQIKSHTLAKGGSTESVWIATMLTSDNTLLSERFDKPITHKELYDKYKSQGYEIKDAQINKATNPDVLESYKDSVEELVQEKYGEDVDWNDSLISYDVIGNKMEIRNAIVRTTDGSEYTITPQQVAGIKKMAKGGGVEGYTDLSYVNPSKIQINETESFGFKDKLQLLYDGKKIAQFHFNMSGYNQEFSLKNSKGVYYGFGGERSKTHQLREFKRALKDGFVYLKSYIMEQGGGVERGNLKHKKGDIVYVYQYHSWNPERMDKAEQQEYKSVPKKYIIGTGTGKQKWSKVEIIEPISDEAGWERYLVKQLDGYYKEDKFTAMQSQIALDNSDTIAIGQMAKGGTTYTNIGEKVFDVYPHAIGKAKYVINWYDGKSTHQDGSPFIGIEIFKYKKDLEKGKEKYRSEGYKEVPNVFNHIHKYAKGGTIAGATTPREWLNALDKSKLPDNIIDFINTKLSNGELDEISLNSSEFKQVMENMEANYPEAIKPKKAEPKPTPAPMTKAIVKDRIKGMKILAEVGDKQAQTRIKGLEILMETL